MGLRACADRLATFHYLSVLRTIKWAPHHSLIHSLPAYPRSLLAEFGDILAVPIDGTGPTCTGHYAESTTFNSNELGGTFTQVLGCDVSRRSDGSLVNFHGLTRYSVNANGELTVDSHK